MLSKAVRFPLRVVFQLPLTGYDITSKIFVHHYSLLCFTKSNVNQLPLAIFLVYKVPRIRMVLFQDLSYSGGLEPETGVSKQPQQHILSCRFMHSLTLQAATR